MHVLCPSGHFLIPDPCGFLMLQLLVCAPLGVQTSCGGEIPNEEESLLPSAVVANVSGNNIGVTEGIECTSVENVRNVNMVEHLPVSLCIIDNYVDLAPTTCTFYHFSNL